MADWIGHYSGGSFPSGHATQAVAIYGMLALVLSMRRPVRVRVWLWAVAALIALVVGASRVYLGAHWMSDVLGGYALGATWLAIVVAVTTAAGFAAGRLAYDAAERAGGVLFGVAAGGALSAIVFIAVALLTGWLRADVVREAQAVVRRRRRR